MIYLSKGGRAVPIRTIGGSVPESPNKQKTRHKNFDIPQIFGQFFDLPQETGNPDQRSLTLRTCDPKIGSYTLGSLYWPPSLFSDGWFTLMYMYLYLPTHMNFHSKTKKLLPHTKVSGRAVWSLVFSWFSIQFDSMWIDSDGNKKLGPIHQTTWRQSCRQGISRKRWEKGKRKDW